jgi:hypothetical protein
MNCIWEEIEAPDKQGWRKVRCVRCGRLTGKTPHTFDRIYATCRLNGLGDYVSWCLAKIGLTKDRWARFLLRIGWLKEVPVKGCGGCERRQLVLNEWGERWRQRYLAARSICRRLGRGW